MHWIMLTIIYIILGALFTNPTPSYEQLAADHFFQTLLKQRYQDCKSIEFDNRTDTARYAGHVYGCDKWDMEERKEIDKGQTKSIIELKTPTTNISIRKTSNSKRLKLFIGTKIPVGDAFVVQIDVHKPFEFVNHYFIKFEKGGKIVDMCEINEII